MSRADRPPELPAEGLLPVILQGPAREHPEELRDALGRLNNPDPGGAIGSDARPNASPGPGSSSRPSCSSGEDTYACDETAAKALCCAPIPTCGNGAVDHPEENCDDGNNDDTDDCLSVCDYRMPGGGGYLC